ncbi:hypothetical protein AB4Y87_23440 [Paenarthrobacter sp. RAF54_2]|uniref:hypothetical protein n=1 Tax=Paenarthrobacter sp. RAF54_2 TaxID=3233061 RepID=UPI003F9E2A10
MTEEQNIYVFVASKRVGQGEVKARQIRALSQLEFRRIDAAIKAVEQYLTGFDAYIWRGLEDLHRTVEKVRTQWAEGGTDLDAGPLMSELEFRVINVCAVVKMYAEHVIVLLGQTYGEESTERDEVKKKLSQLYDSSLPYRVSNHLRNALVHGSPRELLSTNVVTRIKDSGEIVTTVEVLLSREGFRRHAQNAKVRNEVVALPEELELISTVTDAATGLVALHGEIMHLLSPEVVLALEMLAGLFIEAREVLEEGEWVGFLELSPIAVGMRQMRPLMFPESVSKFVYQYLSEGSR